MVFSTGDANDLRDVLARLLAEPSLLQAMGKAATLAGQALQPEVAARYMLDVIRAEADHKASIPAPWYPDCV